MNTKLLKLAVSIAALGALSAAAQTQPTARWQQLLGNMMLSNVDSATMQNGTVGTRAGETQTGMSGVTGTVTGLAGSSIMKLNLCADKSFVLAMEDSASLPGVTGTSSASKIAGSWAISAATQADAKVKLTARKSSDAELLERVQLKTFTVSFTGDRTFVNQTRWYRMKSGVCKK